MATNVSDKLHIFLFPYMAMGHVIPMVDIAKLFAMRGAKSTLLITPTNVPSVTRSIETTQKLGFDINVITIKWPFEEVGLLEDSDNLSNCLKTAETREKFGKALKMLDGPLERLIDEHRPDCLVADVFMPWAITTSSKLTIPKLMFHGSGYFSCCLRDLILHWPHDNVFDDSDTFLIPNFPGQVTMTRAEVPIPIDDETKSHKIKEQSEAELASYGVVMNSFYELEPMYVDHYNKVVGKKSWAVGPVSVCNKSIEDKLERGNRTVGSVSAHRWLEWLDSKQPGSVVYVCFGSFVSFKAHQLREIALGLEASEQQFVWVIRDQDESVQEEEWLPIGYEDRMREKGLLIRGWAPQVLILEHKAVGSFVTHCGWNSTLEGITAGVSMVTWPMGADQYANEKLVTQVLKIGTPVGRKNPGTRPVVFWDDSQVIKSEMVEKAVKKVMAGEEAEEMRRKARGLSEMAKKAVEEGGSSNLAMTSLLEELKSMRAASKTNV